MKGKPVNEFKKESDIKKSLKLGNVNTLAMVALRHIPPEYLEALNEGNMTPPLYRHDHRAEPYKWGDFVRYEAKTDTVFGNPSHTEKYLEMPVDGEVLYMEIKMTMYLPT